MNAALVMLNTVTVTVQVQGALNTALVMLNTDTVTVQVQGALNTALVMLNTVTVTGVFYAVRVMLNTVQVMLKKQLILNNVWAYVGHPF